MRQVDPGISGWEQGCNKTDPSANLHQMQLLAVTHASEVRSISHEASLHLWSTQILELSVSHWDMYPRQQIMMMLVPLPPSRDERPLMHDAPRLSPEVTLLPAWSERGCLCPLVLGQRWGLFIRPAGRQQSQSVPLSFLRNLEHPWTGHPQQTTEHASCLQYMLYSVLYSLNFALNSFSWSSWHTLVVIGPQKHVNILSSRTPEQNT